MKKFFWRELKIKQIHLIKFINFVVKLYITGLRMWICLCAIKFPKYSQLNETNKKKKLAIKINFRFYSVIIISISMAYGFLYVNLSFTCFWAIHLGNIVDSLKKRYIYEIYTLIELQRCTILTEAKQANSNRPLLTTTQWL